MRSTTLSHSALSFGSLSYSSAYAASSSHLYTSESWNTMPLKSACSSPATTLRLRTAWLHSWESASTSTPEGSSGMSMRCSSLMTAH